LNRGRPHFHSLNGNTEVQVAEQVIWKAGGEGAEARKTEP